MAMFEDRGSRDGRPVEEPGVVRVTDTGLELLCRADKHLLADISLDGTLRIWDRRCKRAFTFRRGIRVAD
jgi:hypothetical protein